MDVYDVVHTFTTEDGKRLHSRWLVPPHAEGIVLLVHGLGEYSGRYGHVADRLSQNGLGVVRFDLRGHGRSTGLRGHIKSYDGLLTDVTLMVDAIHQRYPDQKIVIYGHSLGGGLTANWCLRRRNEHHENVVAAVLSAPWFELTKEPSSLEVFLIRNTSRFWPWFTMPSRIKVKDLCRDQNAIRQYKSDKLIHRRITVRLAIEGYDAGRWALAHASECSLPILAFHGSDDLVTSPAATERFCAQTNQAEFDLLPGVVHEPHNDPGWQELIDRIARWCKQRVESTNHFRVAT